METNSTKKNLTDQLENLERQIKSNSKDQHYADRLIKELLSVKGQICLEPQELDCGKKINELVGNTYRITLTDRGVLYHEYGGYNIFVTKQDSAIYDTLADMVVNQDKNNSLEGEDKENIELMLSAVGWILQVPKIALTDARLTIEMATKIINHINEKYNELMGKELQKETVMEDGLFKDAVMAIEEIAEEVKKESKDGK